MPVARDSRAFGSSRGLSYSLRSTSHAQCFQPRLPRDIHGLEGTGRAPGRSIRLSRALTGMAIAIIAVITGITGLAYGATLTPQEQRGKSIYDTGKSPSGGEIKAYFGRDLVEIPGERATCTSCHGYDGTGRPESGVIPTNITWAFLTKNYGHIHPDGLEHGPFTDESLKEYMYTGFYPGGEKGDPSMPLYLMSDRDLDDLIAFLKKLGTLPDPGVTDERIRIGTVLPPEGPSGGIGEAIRKTVEAYFSDINERGGVYHRTLDLIVARVSDTMTKEQLKQSVRSRDLFAQVSTFTPGMDEEMPSVAQEESTPLVGPFTLFPLESITLNRYVFYLLSGLREQLTALVEYASGVVPAGTHHVAVIYPSRKDVAEIVDAAEEYCKSKGWELVTRVEFAPGSFGAETIVEQLRKEGTDIVISLGGEAETITFMKRSEDKGWTPVMLIPGVLMGKGIAEVPKGFKDRIYLAYPTLPEDRKEWAVAELSKLLNKHNVAMTHVSAQVSAYASAKVLVEGLRRAGRELGRERFLSALEGLFEFDTGLTPLITYNRNRRIGALGAYVVAVNPESAGKSEFIVPKGWIPAN